MKAATKKAAAAVGVKAKAFTIITNLKELDAAIASIAKRGAKMDDDIQRAGLSAIDHCERTGDIGPINRLYLALGKGHRKSALVQWYITHAKVSANTDPQSKKEKPFVFDKSKTTDMEGATTKPWHTFKPEPAPDEVFDVVTALHRLLARASNAPSVKGADLFAELKAKAEEYDAKHGTSASPTAKTPTPTTTEETPTTGRRTATTDRPAAVH